MREAGAARRANVDHHAQYLTAQHHADQIASAAQQRANAQSVMSQIVIAGGAGLHTGAGVIAKQAAADIAAEGPRKLVDGGMPGGR